MQADASEKLNMDDVIARFSLFPDELEVIIDNKKLDIKNLDNEKWDRCELAVLERGLAVIKDKQKFYFYQEVAEFVLSIGFLIVEVYIVLRNIEVHSPVFWEAIILNSKLILLATIPFLAVKELIHGGDYSLFPAVEKTPARIIKREIRAIIAIIIFLDLINLLVGAL